MAFGWGQKSVSPIGVDLGHDSVKLLQVQFDDPPQLVAAGSVRVPEQARQSAEAYQQFVTEAIAELVKSGRFRGRRAIASISSGRSIIQHLRLPKCEGELFQQQMEAELRTRLPQSTAGLVVRHVVVGEVVSDGTAKQEVICMAAGRDGVMRTVQSAKAAGLDLVGMHCEPMAVLAAFAQFLQRKEDAERRTMLVDLGCSTSKVVVSHGQKMVFAKTIEVGGEHLCRHLAEARGIDMEQARSIRAAEAERAGARAAGAPAGGLTSQPNRRRGAAVIEPSVSGAGTATLEAEIPADAGVDDPVESLVDELRLCLGYHDSMFADKPVGKVVFVGGESRNTALCRRIAESLAMPAQLGDPLARLVKAGGGEQAGVDLRQSQPGWAVAMGLCQLPSNL